MQSQHAGLPNEYLILTDRVKYFEYAAKHNAKEDRVHEIENKLTELQQSASLKRRQKMTKNCNCSISRILILHRLAFMLQRDKGWQRKKGLLMRAR